MKAETNIIDPEASNKQQEINISPILLRKQNAIPLT
jgi:hypothetical protein